MQSTIINSLKFKIGRNVNYAINKRIFLICKKDFCLSPKIEDTAKVEQTTSSEQKLDKKIEKSEKNKILNETNKSNNTLTDRQKRILSLHRTKEQTEKFYEEKLFYFKHQWTKLQKDKLKNHQNILCPELTPFQQHECDVLIKIAQEFTHREALLFRTEVGRIKSSLKFVKKKVDKEKMYNPNLVKINSILGGLKPFLSSGYFLGGKKTEEPEIVAKVEEAPKEVKKEEKKEKVIVNVRMTGFDPAKKIGLIKEFRTIFNLGLKEAKEMVEKGDILKLNVKREEALDLKNKLETAGAKIELE